MMDDFTVIIFMLFNIPLVAWLDFHIFGKYLKCEKCGSGVGKWHWVLPCLIENLFFIVGVFYGRSI